MTTTFKEDKQAAAEAVLIQQSTAVFERWLVKHPEVNYDAAKSLFREYCDFTDPLSEADFDFAYSNIRDRIAPRRVPTPAEVKATLIDEICELLKSPDGTGREGKYSNFNIAALRTQMQHWEISALTARLAEIRSKQAQVKLTVPELQQIVRDSEPKRRYPGYPNLPEMIVPHGQVQAVKCDAVYLLGLAKHDFYEYKRMCAKFGSQQITDRQRGI
jgi:hypothetical protein